MSDDWTNGITVAVMARRLTPKSAAWVKYQELAIRLATEPNERMDALLAADIGHQWFCFCLDAVARMETAGP